MFSMAGMQVVDVTGVKSEADWPLLAGSRLSQQAGVDQKRPVRYVKTFSDPSNWYILAYNPICAS